MCIALPARVTHIDGNGRTARALIGSTERVVDLAMTPEVGVGDWVISHSGFAVRRITEAAAADIHELLASVDPDD